MAKFEGRLQKTRIERTETKRCAMTLSTGLIALGDVRYDPDRGAIYGPDDTPIALRPQSLDVLHMLASTPGEVVSKDDLIKAVWKDLNVTDDSLTQCIADIRRAIGDDRRAIVQTVPKTGYRLIATETAALPVKGKRRLVGFGAAALAIFAVAIVGGRQLATPPIDKTPQLRSLVTAHVTRTGPSIAVLPFVSIEGDDRWTRLGRGLAADIGGELALNDWLYVTVPESFMNVASGAIPEGASLNVRFALGGTIQARGDDIRISAHLTDARTREVLWSESWSEPQDDVFDVQDRIVANIGANLSSTYSGVVPLADLKRAKRKLTDDLDAYEHYLIGFEQLHRFDPRLYPEAIAHLEAALEIDPEFAGALVTLSVLQKKQAENTVGETSRRWHDASRESAFRAYEIDPNNPNVLWNLARALGLDGQLDVAGQTLRRAVEIAPNNADVLMIAAGYADVAGIAGSEPLAWARRALDLNPKAPAWWYENQGTAAFAAGNYGLAVESMRKAPSNSSGRWLITALAETYRGNAEAARHAAARFRDMAPNLTIEKWAGGTESGRPDQQRVFDAARRLGLPITDQDLKLANTPSIAVLPLEDLTGDPRWQRIGQGLSGEIANELARNAWLYVTAPEATWSIDTGAIEAGRDLDVRFVLSGTIQAEGGTVRILSHLTDVLDGHVLWSERWSEPEDDLFAIQDAVVERIGGSLASTHSGVVAQNGLQRAKRKPTNRLDAYDHYLLGVELKHTFNPHNYPEAIAHLEKAVAIDPQFARAWAILALVRGFSADISAGQLAEVLGAASLSAAERAYAIDPNDPEVLYNYARAMESAGNVEEGGKALLLATEIAPNNADIILIVAWLGGGMGLDGADFLALADRAFELNQKPPPWYHLGRGEAAFYAGDYDESANSYRRGPDSVNKFFYLAIAEALRGNIDAARAAADDLHRVAPEFTTEVFLPRLNKGQPLEAELRRGARLAGIPITARDIDVSKTVAFPK